MKRPNNHTTHTKSSNNCLSKRPKQSFNTQPAIPTTCPPKNLEKKPAPKPLENASCPQTTWLLTDYIYLFLCIYTQSTPILSALPISKTLNQKTNPYQELFLEEQIQETLGKMSARAWIVAASMGAVEALKDQGFCRWNYAIRSIHHNARNSMIRSFSQAKNKLSPHHDDESASAIVRFSNGRLKESEESLRKVMYLSCWGPN